MENWFHIYWFLPAGFCNDQSVLHTGTAASFKGDQSSVLCAGILKILRKYNDRIFKYSQRIQLSLIMQKHQSGDTSFFSNCFSATNINLTKKQNKVKQNKNKKKKQSKIKTTTTTTK